MTMQNLEATLSPYAAGTLQEQNSGNIDVDQASAVMPDTAIPPGAPL